MFIAAPQTTTLETNFLDQSIQGFLCIGCCGLPKTRNAMSRTALTTIKLATTFVAVSMFIRKDF